MSQDNAPTGSIDPGPHIPLLQEDFAEPERKGSAEWRAWQAKHASITYLLEPDEHPNAFGRDKKPAGEPLSTWEPTALEVFLPAWAAGLYETNYVVEPDAYGLPALKYILLAAVAAEPMEEQKPMEPNDDAVNHPAHYGGKDDPYEVIKVLHAWLGPEGIVAFDLGNAVKYIARAGKKNPKTRIEDLHKARWYISHAIAVLEDEAAK